MKTLTLFIFLSLLSISFSGCNSNQFVATNNEKANYLEWKKSQYDDPVKPRNKYNKKSGFGGGKKDR